MWVGHRTFHIDFKGSVADVFQCNPVVFIERCPFKMFLAFYDMRKHDDPYECPQKIGLGRIAMCFQFIIFHNFPIFGLITANRDLTLFFLNTISYKSTFP